MKEHWKHSLAESYGISKCSMVYVTNVLEKAGEILKDDFVVERFIG